MSNTKNIELGNEVYFVDLDSQLMADQTYRIISKIHKVNIVGVFNELIKNEKGENEIVTVFKFSIKIFADGKDQEVNRFKTEKDLFFTEDEAVEELKDRINKIEIIKNY